MWRAAIARTCAAALLLIGCGQQAAPPEPSVASPDGKTGLANPASAHCVDVGGRLVIDTGPVGEYGVCYFEDNHQCEEWALLRGDCPVGGRRITGYATPAGRFCAITGGTYAVVSENAAGHEVGTCSVPDGRLCDAEEYYRQSCGRRDAPATNR